MAERKGREQQGGAIFGVCGEKNARKTTEQQHPASVKEPKQSSETEEKDFMINEAEQKDRCLPGKKNDQHDKEERTSSPYRKAMQRLESSHSSFRSSFDEYCKAMQDKLAKAVRKYREVSEMRNKLEEELKLTRNELHDWRSGKKRKWDKVCAGQQSPEASRKRKYSYNISEGKKCSLCKEACTPSGDHTICSLSCGHFFGKPCITQLFKTKTDGNRLSKCPKCSRKALLKDIRDHNITDMHDAEDEYETVDYTVLASLNIYYN